MVVKGSHLCDSAELTLPYGTSKARLSRSSYDLIGGKTKDRLRALPPALHEPIKDGIQDVKIPVATARGRKEGMKKNEEDKENARADRTRWGRYARLLLALDVPYTIQLAKIARHTASSDREPVPSR